MNKWGVCEGIFGANITPDISILWYHTIDEELCGVELLLIKEEKKSDRQRVTDGSEHRLFLFEKLADYIMVERAVFV
ncbi:hypothetical protein J23TS9_14000 [Paenibacillus sp. J23TS9]|uniref:hypothetical protein n=1 Tax=Paenibacillus sp. J23TS9 TaxID=2807193 RepID=UPI001B08914D|nr:hypothetical protein [Paenibacillus sp. J23TS9]GIP26270.1 hypothetical protein J23TS9_14000 [Paenibacillus sp. J23TS9]